MGSALSSDADENGVRHMLLCRVILGKTEVVPRGSKQFQPSSKEFDSGVDNPLAPRRYIIWNAFMNSHILPEYLLSFKAPCVKGKKFSSHSFFPAPFFFFFYLSRCLNSDVNPFSAFKSFRITKKAGE